MKTRSVPPCVMPCLMPKRASCVTLALSADLPETGYGYIRRGEVSVGEQDTVAFEVAQFLENRIWKPPRPM
ncbi:hypothetical protein ACVXHA_26090 [Escherichia coli]